MKTFWLLGSLLLVASGCSKHTASVPAEAVPSLSVKVALVLAEDDPRTMEVTGTIRPVKRSVIAAKMMGAVSELNVSLGQRVQKDEILAKLASADSEARLTQAQAQLSTVRRDLARERELLSKGVSTAETVRNLEDRRVEAEAQVRDAEVQVGYSELRAPFAGAVSRRWVNAGDLASPGVPLFEVEETENFEVEAGIPASLALSLKPGGALECDSEGVVFTGTLREISSSVDSLTRSVVVKLSVPAGAGVRSGQFTKLLIPGKPVRTYFVPVSSVSLNGQMERVFVVSPGGEAVLRLVKTGATRGGRAEVLSGLSAGETVVVSPPAGLREGSKVEVLP